MKPCPASGSSWSGEKRKPISSSSPSRSSPQAASTTPSRPRSIRRRTRVSTLPRSGSIRRSGRRALSWAVRRIEAVPTRAPGGSSSSEPTGPHRASRGSSRASTAGSARPGTSSVVRSLAEWAATSMRPSSSASSSSFVKIPRSPSSWNGRRRSRSPTVEIGTSATGPSPASRSASAAIDAWCSASLEPRVPSRSGPRHASGVGRAVRQLEPEQVAHGLGVGHAVGGRGALAQPHRRLVQQPPRDRPAEPLEPGTLVVVQRRPAGGGPGDLLGRELLAVLAQPHDRRHHDPRGLPLAELLGLGRADLLGGRGLLPAQGDVARHHGLQVVEVVQHAALDPAHLGLDVPRHRQVDQQQRVARAAGDGPAHHVRGQHGCGAEVDETTRSAAGSRSCTSSKRTAEAPRRSARVQAAANVRVETTTSRRPRPIRLRAASSEVWPAPIRSAERPSSPPSRAPGELCGHRGHGRVLGGDARLAAHPFAGLEGALEGAVQERPDRALLLGHLQRLAHLAEDLDLARDERVEPGGDPAQVQGGDVVAQVVERGVEPRGVGAGNVRELGPGHRVDRGRIRPGDVDLGAVAGGDDRGLGGAGSPQVGQETAAAGLVEGHGAAQVELGGAVREADGDEAHQGTRVPTGTRSVAAGWFRRSASSRSAAAIWVSMRRSLDCTIETHRIVSEPDDGVRRGHVLDGRAQPQVGQQQAHSGSSPASSRRTRRRRASSCFPSTSVW